MFERLVDKMNKIVRDEGMSGKARLAMAANKSTAQIDRYRNKKCKLSSDIAKKLARECGFNERDADELALECSHEAKAG